MSRSDTSWSAGVKTALIALPILYVLSIGPAIYAFGAMRSSVSPQVSAALDTFYKPVTLLSDHTPLKTPLEWYFELAVRAGLSLHGAYPHLAMISSRTGL